MAILTKEERERKLVMIKDDFIEVTLLDGRKKSINIDLITGISKASFFLPTQVEYKTMYGHTFINVKESPAYLNKLVRKKMINRQLTFL